MRAPSERLSVSCGCSLEMSRSDRTRRGFRLGWLECSPFALTSLLPRPGAQAHCSWAPEAADPQSVSGGACCAEALQKHTECLPAGPVGRRAPSLLPAGSRSSRVTVRVQHWAEPGASPWPRTRTAPAAPGPRGSWAHALPVSVHGRGCLAGAGLVTRPGAPSRPPRSSSLKPVSVCGFVQCVAAMRTLRAQVAAVWGRSDPNTCHPVGCAGRPSVLAEEAASALFLRESRSGTCPRRPKGGCRDEAQQVQLAGP